MFSDITKFKIDKTTIHDLYNKFKNRQIRVIEVKFNKYNKPNTNKITRISKKPMASFIQHINLIQHNFKDEDISKIINKSIKNTTKKNKNKQIKIKTIKK